MVATPSGTTRILTFTGAGIGDPGGSPDGGSIADGVYDLSLGNTLLTTFHRLFGDVNGDGFVDTGDLNSWKNTANSEFGDINFDRNFDVNYDDFIDTEDLNRFKDRINKSFEY